MLIMQHFNDCSILVTEAHFKWISFILQLTPMCCTLKNSTSYRAPVFASPPEVQYLQVILKLTSKPMNIVRKRFLLICPEWKVFKCLRGLH